MVQIKGKYKHEKNENIEEYFSEIGVPFMARKMISLSSPTVEISEDDDSVWKITTKTFVRHSEVKFKLGEEYEEVMPTSVVLKNVTTLSGDKLETVTQSSTGVKTLMTYTFTEDGMVVTMVHEQSGKTAKRYYKRL